MDKCVNGVIDGEFRGCKNDFSANVFIAFVFRSGLKLKLCVSLSVQLGLSGLGDRLAHQLSGTYYRGLILVSNRPNIPHPRC